jgi:hypothetical protein
MWRRGPTPTHACLPFSPVLLLACAEPLAFPLPGGLPALAGKGADRRRYGIVLCTTS